MNDQIGWYVKRAICVCELLSGVMYAEGMGCGWMRVILVLLGRGTASWRPEVNVNMDISLSRIH